VKDIITCIHRANSLSCRKVLPKSAGLRILEEQVHTCAHQ
jgi:hypothetical protein